jgi:hypothetical protein
MAKFNVGDRVKIVDRARPASFGQTGRVVNVQPTLLMGPATIAGRVGRVGPWYGIKFDKAFEGDHAFYSDSELAKA